MERINYKDYKKIILVEGENDKKIIGRLVENPQDFLIDTYAIGQKSETNDGGKYNLSKKLNELKNFSFDSTPNVYILIDADGSFKDAFKYVVKILEKINADSEKNYYSIPDSHCTVADGGYINVGIFVIPDNENVGCLESLLLESVTDQNLLDITKVCYSSVELHYGDKFNEVSLSHKEYFRYLLYVDSVRVLYKHDYNNGVKNGFDINSDKFTNLKIFLNS